MGGGKAAFSWSETLVHTRLTIRNLPASRRTVCEARLARKSFPRRVQKKFFSFQIFRVRTFPRIFPNFNKSSSKSRLSMFSTIQTQRQASKASPNLQQFARKYSLAESLNHTATDCRRK